MPEPDFVLRLNDHLEPLTIIAQKTVNGVSSPIDEDLTSATCKFTLKTWKGALLLDHVTAQIPDRNAKELGFDWTPVVAQLEPSPLFYHHKGWFTLNTDGAGNLLSVPNDTYIYIRITADG